MNNLKTVLLYCIYKRRTTILLLLPVLLLSCRFYRAPVPSADYYYLNPDKDLSAIGRVAIIELDSDSSYPQVSTDVTEALFQALQKKQLFSLTIVRRGDSEWRSLQLDSDPPYTLEQLFAIRRTLRCDAVLMGTFTGYRPYPHMTIGLRLKLLDLADGRLLWAFEQIWDSADKKTEHQIKRFFSAQMRSGFGPLRERLVVISPLRFIKFVAYEVAETLQTKR